MVSGRLAVVVVASGLGLAAPVLADDTSTAQGVDPATISAAADEIRFAEYASRGDRARAAGKIGDAVIAYSDALAIRSDPLIAGRLGMLLVKMGRHAQAADLLHTAVNRDWSASPTERKAFTTAYGIARDAVCMVDVQVSHAPETTTIDGKPWNRARMNAFFVFLSPGEHEIRATLTGYRDGRAVFTACKGGSMDVPVTLTPLPPDPPIEPTPAPKAPPEPAAIPRPPGLPEVRMEPLGEPRLGMAGAVAVVDGKPLPKQEDPYGYDDTPGGDGKKSGVRGSIGAGPVMVLGVASWAPAVGVVLSGSVRLMPVLSLDLDARAAWLTSGIGGRPLQAMTAGGIASICGHWHWLFGCASGHLGIIRVESTQDIFANSSFTWMKPGLGGRLGAQWVGSRLGARLSVELIGFASRTRIDIERTTIADQPAVMAGVSAVGLWSF
ncbi:hypothetical protein [Polyangium fumosum]|uniref:PEGA domain-containing protein n=1 Tax=Polyangium fumosum TaxID=889272 RepID=A0A4U1I6L0_9BACT|nr:hypothetical protein [Polyangium fumosum]TKC89013.1 hypothetical protein E8A74_51465 [Polyangium fumosum]